MQRNYMSMSGYGSGYQPMAPFALTQPEAIPSWMPAQAAPVQRSFPMASAAAPAFNYETDMAGLMPTSTPLGGTPTNFEISQGWGGTTPGGGSNWFRDSGFLSSKNPDGTMSQGWGGLALGGAQALGSLYLGMQQYGLAKETLANNKAQFERNFNAQKATTNASLEDRQRARVAANPGAYQSVGDYMNQNGVR
jgi:hypothetical protein